MPTVAIGGDGGGSEGDIGMGWFRNTEGDGGDTPSLEERLAQIGPGAPGRCPACDGLGYIDTIDIGHRYQIQHCTVCRHRWEYLFDADGAVIGLTELDDGDDVLDLREPAVAEQPALDLTPGEHLSPAAWIRRSTRR